MTGSTSSFTAAQIAACLWSQEKNRRLTPQAVRKALKGIEAAAVKIVAGLETAAWRLDQVPRQLRDRLEAEARHRNYRSAEAMLSAPPRVWEPAIPLNQIADKDVDQASKLRQALLPWVAQQHTLDLAAAELERRGVEDYARIFGHRISCRYWRELFTRTIGRDAGAENWNRLEVYLSEKPAAKESSDRKMSREMAEQFGRLGDYITACSNPAAPSRIEQRGIWTLALSDYAELVRTGTPPKEAARNIRDFLSAKAPSLAPSRDALLKAFSRKLADLERAGGDVNALRDGREQNGDRFQLPEQDRDLLIHRAVFYYRGDVAPAWRDCLRNGFSQVVADRYPANSTRKSHVPTMVMDSVSSEVEILTVMHQGARAFDSIRGHVDRNYDGIASLRCMSADDFTMPVYYYVPDGNGWFILTRGQILVFIDFRSLAVIGWSMQPDRNYSSLTIRSLCTHVFGEHGIPEVLQFERGIWESSSLLKGRDPAPFEFTEVVQGLREFGIRFVHSIRPRSKVVERVGGLLQDLMEAEPGYCGRDERRDGPEETHRQIAAVNARRAHPSEFFYSYAQWFERFGKIVDQYNSAPQGGRILGGLSPGEALARFADKENPPMQLSAQVRYLLAHDKRPATVTLNGITIRVGKQKFNYKGRQISGWGPHGIGDEVLVWFDPENPESIVVTDMKRRNPVCVNAQLNPSAMECLVNPESGELAQAMRQVEDQASYMKARFKAVRSKFEMPQRRLLADARTLQLGESISQQKSEQKTEQKARATRGAANKERARRLNVPGVLVGDDEQTRHALELLAEAERDHSQSRPRTTEHQEEQP